MTSVVPDAERAVDEPRRPRFLSPNPGKRSAERFYLIWFLVTIPFQRLISANLSFEHPNDGVLVAQGVVMGAVAWFGPLFFRAAEDKGKPFYQVYAFKFGCYLAIWAMVGGYLGTDPWYEVLSGHFAFNTDWNPNGVPFFMLPMTIAVFGFYSAILGGLYRIGWRWYESRDTAIPPIVARVALILPLSVLMPLIETVAYSSDSYCYDHGAGKWAFNIIVYGTWQAAALFFYTRFDERPGEDQPLRGYLLRGFATVAILLFANQLVTNAVAPHFTDVNEGVRYVNDWSPDNCLGPKPD